MKLLSLPIVISLFLLSCHKSHEPANTPPPPSPTKFINSFELLKTDNPGVIDTNYSVYPVGDTIRLTISTMADLTALKPVIKFTGKSISPASGVAQNFTKPVNYTVTAEDGSTRTYVALIGYRRTLFLSTLSGIISAVDAGVPNGAVLWSTNVSTSSKILAFSAPTVGLGKVFVTSSDGLYAFDANSGRQVWKASVPEPAFRTRVYRYSVPLFSGNVIYAGFADGTVRAFDAANGQQRWSFMAGAGQGVFSSPTLDRGRIFIGSNDSCVYSLDAVTGAFNWKFKTRADVGANPLVFNNIVYAGTMYGYPQFNAIDADNGQKIWSQPVYVAYPSAIALDGKIYSSADDEILGFDPLTGSLIFEINFMAFRPVGSGLFGMSSSLAVDEGRMFVGSMDHHVYAIDMVTKAKIWDFAGRAAFSASPVVCNGIVYISDEADGVYGLQASDGKLVMNYSGWNYYNQSACIVDENGKIYHPAESGEVN